MMDDLIYYAYMILFLIGGSALVYLIWSMVLTSGGC